MDFVAKSNDSNISNYDMSEYAKITDLYFNVPFASLGVVLNLLSITVWNCREMKSTIAIYMTSLAMYDTMFLCFFLLNISFYGIANFEMNIAYNKNSSFYKHLQFGLLTAGEICKNGSIFTTIALTLDRAVAICSPFKYVTVVKTVRVKVTMVFVCIICVALSFPKIVYVIVFRAKREHREVFLVFLKYVHPTFVAWLPAVVISVLNVVIFVSLIVHRHRTSGLKQVQNKSRLSLVSREEGHSKIQNSDSKGLMSEVNINQHIKNKEHRKDSRDGDFYIKNIHKETIKNQSCAESNEPRVFKTQGSSSQFQNIQNQASVSQHKDIKKQTSITQGRSSIQHDTVVRISIQVLVISLMTWAYLVPYGLMFLQLGQTNGEDLILKTVGKTLHVFNSSVNFFLYCFIGRKFRACFLKKFACLCFKHRT